MKKIITLVFMSLICVMCLCGCNQNLGFGNFEFKHAHFSDGVSSHCVEVKSWHDDSMGCEIHSPEGGIFLSEGTYQLFESADTCPYCN